MQNRLIKITMMASISLIFTLAGCGNGSSESVITTDKEPVSRLPDKVLDAIDAPKSSLSPKLKDAITYCTVKRVWHMMSIWIFIKNRP